MQGYIGSMGTYKATEGYATVHLLKGFRLYLDPAMLGSPATPQ